YHLIMRPRRSNTLLSFNFDHRLISNKAINFQFDSKNIQLNDFVETRAGRFAYFIDYEKRSNQLSLLVSSFENQAFTNTRAVLRQSFKAGWGFRRVEAGAHMIGGDINNSLSISIDSSKVAMANILSTRDQNTPEAYALAVFDENFELLWKKIQVFEYRDRDLQVIQSVVSNDGTLYLLARLLDRPTLLTPADKRGLPRYSYKVFQVTETDHQTFDIELESGTAPQYAGLYFPDPNAANFIVSGFYTTNERRSGLKGLFLNKVNVATAEVSSTTYPLEAEFLKNLISNRDLKKDRGLNAAFRIKDFLQFEDGSFGFIAEEYYVTVRTQGGATAGSMQTQTYVYHSNQMVIPRFSAEGEFLNIQKIDKSYTSENAQLTSYSMAFANGKVYLVYNDYKRAAERKELRESGRRRGRYTDMTIIDENGIITFQETLFSSKEIDMNYFPQQSDFSEDYLLIVATKGKRYKCGLISLDE
ncbi:MAG: hypothetical protein AAGJ93_07815, partial [Bacteroidota bacterium]